SRHGTSAPPQSGRRSPARASKASGNEGTGTGALPMKLFGVVAALVGTLLLCVSLLSAAGEHPAAAQPSAAPQRPLVFVPGLLGSKLGRTGEEREEVVVWGTAEALGNFPALALEGAAGLEIVPCGLIRDISYLGIFSQAVYRPFIERLATAGYREGETLF